MNKKQYQRWPDGTSVVFTQEAKDAMLNSPSWKKPLRAPAQGPHRAYTIDNTDDGLHDVTLRETGERYGTYWLQAEGPEQPFQPTLPIFDQGDAS